MIGFILLSFFTLAVIGVPVGIVVALTTLFGFYYTDNTVYLSMIAQRMFSGMDSFTFLALPFFLLAGEIMNKVGLTGRLIDFSNLFFGRLKGGLGAGRRRQGVFPVFFQREQAAQFLGGKA